MDAPALARVRLAVARRREVHCPLFATRNETGPRFVPCLPERVETTTYPCPGLWQSEHVHRRDVPTGVDIRSNRRPTADRRIRLTPSNGGPRQGAHCGVPPAGFGHSHDNDTGRGSDLVGDRADEYRVATSNRPSPCFRSPVARRPASDRENDLHVSPSDESFSFDETVAHTHTSPRTRIVGESLRTVLACCRVREPTPRIPYG